MNDLMNLALFFAVLFLVSCSNSPGEIVFSSNQPEDGDTESCTPGSLGCACEEDGSCDEGLQCTEEGCVDPYKPNQVLEDGDPDGPFPDDDDDDDLTDCQQGNACARDEDCCGVYLCHPQQYTCQVAQCDTHLDCEFIASASSGYEWDCDNGFCIHTSCQSDPDCAPGYRCNGGQCKEAATSCASVARLEIDQPGLVLHQGYSVQLSVMAYDLSGAPALFAEGYYPFLWSIEQRSGQAQLTTDGLVTGGAVSGEFVVRVACVDDLNKTTHIVGMNHAETPASSVRVILVDDQTMQPVVGARVGLEGNSSVSVTDSSGVALFTGQDCSSQGCTVHAHDSTGRHHPVSVVEIQSNDLLIPMSPVEDETVSAGFKAPFYWDDIPAIFRQDFRFGFAGTSAPNLLGYRMANQFGEERLLTSFEMGSIEEELLLPKSLEMWLDETRILGPSYVSGRPGIYSLWGFGGYARMADMIGIVTDTITGEGTGLHDLSEALMPILETFYHGLFPSLEFQAINKIVDYDDQNNNGETDDLISDFDLFPTLPNTDGHFHLTQRLDHHLTVQLGNLPNGVRGVSTLVGFYQPRLGLIPLGFGFDYPQDEEDSLESVKTLYALQHGAHSGYPYIVMIYVKYGDEQPIFIFGDDFEYTQYKDYNTSVVIDVLDTLPPEGNLSISGLLSPFASVCPSHGEDRLRFQSDPNATFVRAAYRNEGLTWYVYYPAGNQDLSIHRSGFMPDGFTEDKGELIAARLVNGPSFMDYSSLFTFNETTLLHLNHLLKSYVIYDIHACR